MANEDGTNNPTRTNESLNPVADLIKSLNPAVPLAQTIAEPQTSGTGTTASSTTQSGGQTNNR